MTAKNVILTAIHFKGTSQMRAEAREFADKCLCSEGYVLSVIRQVEKSQIVIK